MSSNADTDADARLAAFSNGAADPDAPGFDPSLWPLSVNGHRVYPTAPETIVRGGDDELAFECVECGEHIIPPSPEKRSVSDRQWASNRFETIVCEADSSADAE